MHKMVKATNPIGNRTLKLYVKTTDEKNPRKKHVPQLRGLLLSLLDQISTAPKIIYLQETFESKVQNLKKCLYSTFAASVKNLLEI